MEIKEIKKELGKKFDPKAFLRDQLEKETSPSLKVDIRKELIKVIKDKGLVKLKNGDPAVYKIGYDSMGEGVEPIYFWILDFMRTESPSGLGLEVAKTEEDFESSVGSGFFGEFGTRASVMQDRAMKMVATVNTVVRSMLNLVYDLREFKIRLETYDDADPAKQKDPDKLRGAEMVLKTTWMDQVDIKKGRGGINMMAQDLQFVTLRDSFMQARSVKDVKSMDLNERVKRVLLNKLTEFASWRTHSEKELRKRFEIERAYLKSQVDSLKLYTKWIKPYLKAAQKLGMKDFTTPSGLPSPNIISTFNTMEMALNLFGKKEVKPGSVYDAYKKIKTDKKVYACLEVNFQFRTIPQGVGRTQGGATQYLQSGSTEMTFTPYVFTDDEIEELEKQELWDDMDIVENLTNVSLKELQTDLDDLLKEEKKEEKKKKKSGSTLGNPLKGFKEAMHPIKDLLNSLSSASSGGGYAFSKVKDKAKSTALKQCLAIYDVYKKAHGMVTW